MEMKFEHNKKAQSMTSRLRSIVETPFYGNNVIEVNTLAHAYALAKESPGTIELDMPVKNPAHLGLPEDAKVLLFNDGSVTGRAAAARRIIGDKGVNQDDLDKKVMDAVYDTRWSTLYHATALVGLEEDFMVRAHLLVPQGEENLLYNWMLNFQQFTEEYLDRYQKSQDLEGEGDIFIFSSPQWSHPDHPLGLTYFDPENNCAALLGMRYFGEHKKGTLTLAWSIANRNGFASCHGGAKSMAKEGQDPFTLAVFGLSGSGKSTLTHANHKGQYDIEILHDDAFIINDKEKYLIALEPTYFDKTQDYPAGSPENAFLLTIQNCGVTRDENGALIPTTEDIRNGNGRAIKSKWWAPNRVDRINSKINAICWIMKDAVLPPVLKIENPVLASLMGATLSTKRTSAERLAEGIDPTKLVIEPYANPFRTYPLSDDYQKFLSLFEDGVDCYVFNTGDFLGKNIPKELTLQIIEEMADQTMNIKAFKALEGVSFAEYEGFEVDFENKDYTEAVKASFAFRNAFLEKLSERDQLPQEALDLMKDIIQ